VRRCIPFQIAREIRPVARDTRIDHEVRAMSALLEPAQRVDQHGVVEREQPAREVDRVLKAHRNAL
jgi:hypothetical protein